MGDGEGEQAEEQGVSEGQVCGGGAQGQACRDQGTEIKGEGGGGILIFLSFHILYTWCLLVAPCVVLTEHLILLPNASLFNASPCSQLGQRGQKRAAG